MRKSIYSTICALLTAFCLTAVVFAAPPKTISYQGYLKDAAGKPVTAATNLTFRLYSSTRAESGALWSEARSVTPANGVYSVELGTGTPLDSLPFDVQYFLGVTVESGAELVPRQPLTSAPYAIRAAQFGQREHVSQPDHLHRPHRNAAPAGVIHDPGAEPECRHGGRQTCGGFRPQGGGYHDREPHAPYTDRDRQSRPPCYHGDYRDH